MLTDGQADRQINGQTERKTRREILMDVQRKDCLRQFNWIASQQNRQIEKETEKE